MADIRSAVLDGTARSCDEGIIVSIQNGDIGWRTVLCEQPETHLGREHHQRNERDQIKQRDHSTRSDHEFQSSEVEVITPYREKPRVRALLGIEESQSRCRAHESSNRDD